MNDHALESTLRELDGQPVASPADSAVYLLQAGQRRWVTSPEVLARLGFEKDEVRQLPDALLEQIPKGEPIGADVREAIQYQVAGPYLQGRGIELGSGPAPRRVPPGATLEQFDKRTAEELAEYFRTSAALFQPTFSLSELPKRYPDGADFLIAHHVLEHCSNPIGVLAGWHGHLRSGGVMVVTVPHVDYCPDRGRLLPTLEHLMMDHLFDRTDDAFESREHVYSFLMGWADDGFAKGIDKLELARKAHECVRQSKADLHWHAWRAELLIEVIEAAATFSGCHATIRATAHPDQKQGDGNYRAEGEIICVYQLERLPAHVAPRPSATVNVFRGLETKLARALATIQAATTVGRSRA